MKRRQIVKAMGAAGLVTSLPLATLVRAQPKQPLNILFMGGTGFIGPHMVRAVAALGHKMTLFNRGKTNPDLFEGIELIKGDRLSADIEQLSGRRWDIIIDSSCYVPRAVRLLMEAIDREQVQQYIFISTISVYADFSQPGNTEDSSLASMDDPTSEDVDAHYGALKVLCEQAAVAALPGKVNRVRCGVIIGPGDKSDRFTYWPERVFRGGEVLAPGDGSAALQTLDARDLADWIAYCVENNVTGVFNATNRAGAYNFADLLNLCQREINREAQLTWVPAAFLSAQGVRQIVDLPLWTTSDGPYAGVWRINSQRAAAAGLTHRPLEVSIRDTHRWFQAQPTQRRNKMRAGWTQQREAEVLAAWMKQDQ